MKAVVCEKPGDESVLTIGEVADPKAGPGQLLIRVKYAGLNRADLMQRRGSIRRRREPRKSWASNARARSPRSERASADGASANARWL